MSDKRPTNTILPSSRSKATSFVCSHPSSSMACPVASGKRQYSAMINGPRTMISPASPLRTTLHRSSTRRNSQSLSGLPMLSASRSISSVEGTAVTAPAASVRAYMVVMAGQISLTRRSSRVFDAVPPLQEISLIEDKSVVEKSGWSSTFCSMTGTPPQTLIRFSSIVLSTVSGSNFSR